MNKIYYLLLLCPLFIWACEDEVKQEKKIGECQITDTYNQISSVDPRTFVLGEDTTTVCWVRTHSNPNNPNSVYYSNYYDEPVEYVRWIVAHSTANEKSHADALWHAFHLDTTGFVVPRWRTSWQMSVDTGSIVQHHDIQGEFIPSCWHAGEEYANRNSIGVEVCENADELSRGKARKNLVFTLAVLQAMHPNARIVRHKDITGKNCPRIYNDEEWLEILEDVKRVKILGKRKLYTVY